LSECSEAVFKGFAARMNLDLRDTHR
jgi:hypothetical protein